KKVPSIDEISEKIDNVVNKLKEQEGISNVQMESNYDDFIFKLQCDFTSIKTLQDAITNIIKVEAKNSNLKDFDTRWLSFEDDKLTRSIPQITIEKTSQLKKEDAELLKEGSYTTITRFERDVES